MKQMSYFPAPWFWNGNSLFCTLPPEDSNIAMASFNQLSPFLMPLMQRLPEIVAHLVTTPEGRAVLELVAEDMQKVAKDIFKP